MSDTVLEEVRPGEIAAALPDRIDAQLVFIGRIRTPYLDRKDCPHHGSTDGPLCRLEVDELWRPALRGLTAGMRLQVIYWMHLARRDLVLQNPGSKGHLLGTFAVRSPVRPNPISTSVVDVVDVKHDMVTVRGLDCVDGTPLLDLKPERCLAEQHELTALIHVARAADLTFGALLLEMVRIEANEAAGRQQPPLMDAFAVDVTIIAMPGR